MHITSRGASWQHRQWVWSSAHSGTKAWNSSGSADLPQQAAHTMGGLLPQAADALGRLFEEVRHQGAWSSSQSAVQVAVVNVDGKQDGVETWRVQP